MKKFFAIVLTVFILASTLCVGVVPASAGGYSVVVCGYSYDYIEWGLGVYDDFEDAWNDAIYYSTHLDEAWNSSERYESEADRPEVEGFSRIIVYFYDDWNADSEGSFGSGLGFKDGAIYIPADAKIEVDLCGHTINSGSANGDAMYIDTGADAYIHNGTVIGGMYADRNAKVKMTNVSDQSASIFGEGSLVNILVIISLVASVISISLTLTLYKKATKKATKEDGE